METMLKRIKAKSASARAVFFKAAFILVAICKAATTSGEARPNFSLSGMSKQGVYTRTTSRSLVISENDSLVIEEADSLLRPTRRTEWRDGKEYAVTVWEYFSEGMYPCIRVTTSPEGTSRVAFDSNGMESEDILFSSGGDVLSRLQMEYEPSRGEKGGQNLVSSIQETRAPEKDSVSKEQKIYTYNEDGSVKSCTIYKEGVLAKIIQYGEGNSRTETVFYEGEAIYTAEYRDGVRVRPKNSWLRQEAKETE